MAATERRQVYDAVQDRYYADEAVYAAERGALVEFVYTREQAVKMSDGTGNYGRWYEDERQALGVEPIEGPAAKARPPAETSGQEKNPFRPVRTERR